MPLPRSFSLRCHNEPVDRLKLYLMVSSDNTTLCVRISLKTIQTHEFENVLYYMTVSFEKFLFHSKITSKFMKILFLASAVYSSSYHDVPQKEHRL